MTPPTSFLCSDPRPHQATPPTHDRRTGITRPATHTCHGRLMGCAFGVSTECLKLNPLLQNIYSRCSLCWDHASLSARRRTHHATPAKRITTALARILHMRQAFGEDPEPGSCTDGVSGMGIEYFRILKYHWDSPHTPHPGVPENTEARALACEFIYEWAL